LKGPGIKVVEGGSSTFPLVQGGKRRHLMHLFSIEGRFFKRFHIFNTINVTNCFTFVLLPTDFSTILVITANYSRQTI
jgi:hypothetical protein